MPLLLAPKDAARILGVTTGRVQQLDREGKLRAIRDSANRRLFREGDVLKFAASRKAQGR